MKYEPTEEQRAEFSRRLKLHMPVLYKLIGKYDFINQYNVDDFVQEALACCWINYFRFKHSIDDGARFGGWFRFYCRAGIIAYLKYLSVRTRSEYALDFDVSQEDEIDDTDAQILALYHCIEELPPEDQKLVHIYLECETRDEMVRKAGYSESRFKQNIRRVKCALKTRMSHYYFGIQQARESVLALMGQDAGIRNRGRAIDQIDFDGQLVQRFSNMKAVSEKGFSQHAVSSVISNRQKSHRGFYWKVASD